MIDFLVDKFSPETGGSITIGSFITGMSLEMVTFETQQQYLFWAQMAAFVTSVVVGLATLCVLYQKIKRNNPHT